MPRERIRSRLFAGGQAVVDVPPMVGRGVSRIDAASFDGVDRPQNVVDLGPAVDAQKNLAAGTDERQRRIGFARRYRARDVDARDDRPEVVGRPAHEGEDGAGREADDALPAVEDRLVSDAAETDPVLDSLLEPGQLDTSKIVCSVLGSAVSG